MFGGIFDVFIPHHAKAEFNSNNTDWWPCFHHDIANSGFTTSHGPNTNEVKWIFDEISIKSSPCVVNNHIYFGSPHLTSFPAPIFEGSFVYCLDENGQEIWKYLTSGDLESTPTVHNNKLYIGSSHGHLLCLYANNGDLIWSQTTGDRIASSPVVYDDMVFFGSYDNSFYCLDANTGDILWTYNVDGDIYSSAAIYDNKVYFGSLNTYIYCLDAYNGNLQWKFKTNGEVYSSPAVFDDNVFIGSADQNMYCLHASTGEKIWSCDVQQKIYKSSPAVSNEKLFVGTSIGDIICFDRTKGDELWRYETNAWVSSSPAVIIDKLYVGSYDKYLYCLDTNTGDEIWKYKTKSDIESSPAIVDGNVYIGSGMDFYCFGDDESPIPNLDCEGSFHWTEIKPGSLITDNFTIRNNGDPGSVLNWKIHSLPSWGEWIVTPNNGKSLLPSDGSVTVEVFVVAPDVKESTFSGEILVINEDDSSDFETIPIKLSTPKNTHPLLTFIEYYLDRFPVLRPLMQYSTL